MQSASKWYQLTNFKLKLLAFLFMTIDHIGFELQAYMYYNTVANNCGLAFRYIGRLAMPLFAFMIMEGVMHTKSYKRYAGRLGFMAGIITAALAVCFILTKCRVYDLKSVYTQGNIFLDLLLGSFLVFALMNKNNKFKLLSLIPLAISILSYVVKMLEVNGNMEIYWYPAFLRLQYDWISVVLIGLFFVGKLLTKVYYKYQKQITGIDEEIWKENGQYRKMDNLISCGVLVIFTGIYFAITYFTPGYRSTWDPAMQSMMAVSGAFILLYTGTRGYNKKWFQIFSYWYYPVHMVIIAGIFVAIFGI